MGAPDWTQWGQLGLTLDAERLNQIQGGVGGGGGGTDVDLVADYGVTAGAGQGAANLTKVQDACDDHSGDSAVLTFPMGAAYELNYGLQVPTKVSLNNLGRVDAAGTWPADSGMVLFKNGTGQGREGGLLGQGIWNCRRLAAWGWKVDTWRNARFDHTVVADPIDGAWKTVNTNGDSTNQYDCDSNWFMHCFMFNYNSGFSAATERPRRLGVFQQTPAGRLVTDNFVIGCQTIGGMLPESSAGLGTNGQGAGTWGIEMINSDRNLLMANKLYGHNERLIGGSNVGWSGAYLLRATGGDNCSGNVIWYPYAEATIATPVHANWEFQYVRLEQSSGAGSLEYNQINGLQQSVNATGANARRLVMERIGSGGIRYNRFKDPRNIMGNNGQILIGNGCTNNRIEVARDSDIARVTHVVADDNRVVSMTPG